MEVARLFRDDGSRTQIVDSKTHERLAGLFDLHHSYLDIEEFFVWPSARHRGIGHQLHQWQIGESGEKTLRAWVSFADADEGKRDELNAFLRMNRLYLHSSPEPWAAYVALPQVPAHEPSQTLIPQRPTSVRDHLRSEYIELTRKGSHTKPESPLFRVWQDVPFIVEIGQCLP